MTYVIGEPCVDVLDRACVEECPVDCIYEGERMLYIHPDECVDCGACEPVCPVEAIYYEDDLPGKWQAYAGENARFFAEPLPGRERLPGCLNRNLKRARHAAAHVPLAPSSCASSGLRPLHVFAPGARRVALQPPGEPRQPPTTGDPRWRSGQAAIASPGLWSGRPAPSPTPTRHFSSASSERTHSRGRP